jgi:outer membrane receptor protein involved in Fe transport
MNLRRLMLWCVVMVPTLAIALHVQAQTSKGIIVGVVRDQSGAVIANATVTVTSEETSESRRTSANDRGEFRIDAVNPGNYAVHVDAPSFQSVDVRDLSVPPSVVTSYNPVLGTRAVAETVTVNATTNGINTENGGLSTTVGTTELTQVPIFSLNPFELLQNIPGAQIVDPNLGLGGVGGNFVQIEVNGARPRSNNFMMDGQDINDIGIGGQAFNIAIPDAFQSITALTNSASAEFGRSGGAVINLVTRAGSNQFHGDVWELYTGSGLDSLDGITRQGKPYANNPKSRYDEHQFGFTAGGPVWKNKLFAFGALQFTRFYGNTQPVASSRVELPDAAGYAKLTAIGGPQVALLQSYLYNGSYLNTYTNLGAANAYKISSRPGCVGGCSVSTAFFLRPSIPQQEPDTQWLYRIDFIPSARDTLTARYLHDRANFNPDLALNTSGLPGFDAEVGGPAEVGQGSWTHIFSPQVLNEFRASETRTNALFQPTAQTRANPLSTAYNITFFGQGFGGQNTPLGISQNIPQGTILELYQFQDTVSWSHGRHTVRAGVDIGRQIEIDIVAQNALGGLTYTGNGALSPLDNFLDNYLGASGQATKTFGPTRIDPHSWKTAVFVQDDVKLTPDLTINLGLRYDYLTPPENVMKYPAIDINNPFAPIDTVVKVNSDSNNFGPRFGFAWNPHQGIFTDGKTAFHGGIGAFYDTDFTNIATNDAQASPNAPTGTLQSSTGRGLANSTSLLNTITPTLSPLSAVQSISSNLRNPLTWQWNMGIERQLPAQLKLAVNYVGNHGEKLYANEQMNYFSFATGKRINPARGVINIRANRADSEYNSLQTELSRQMSHGTFVRVAYTYGKDLDDASDVFSTFAAPTSYSADLTPNGLGRDWGPSVWDHRHYFAITYVWAPAGFHSSNFGTDALLSAFTRHFTISGTTQLQSGYHSTFNVSGIDVNGDGSPANDRPMLGNRSKPLDTAGFDGIYFGPGFNTGVYYDAVTALPVTASDVHWLVPFGPQFVPFGIGRNSFENPGTQFWNIAAEKTLPTSWLHFDRGSLVVRVEAQNFTNHDNIGPLDINLLDIGTPNFMNPQNAIEPNNRHLLAWAKFRF